MKIVTLFHGIGKARWFILDDVSAATVASGTERTVAKARAAAKAARDLLPGKRGPCQRDAGPKSKKQA